MSARSRAGAAGPGWKGGRREGNMEKERTALLAAQSICGRAGKALVRE